MKNIIYIIILFILISCKEEKANKPVDNAEMKETLIRANQLMAQKESEEINSFMKRHELKLEQTGTGLRFEILNKGNSNLVPAESDAVIIQCRINLLDGTAITDEDSDTMSFIMGRAEAPKGLEEGLSMIGEGGKIFLIIPSHLAYGRTGNEASIPGNSPLVVNAELINVKKNNTQN